MNKKFYGIAASALFLGLFASCSNDVNNTPETPEGPDSTLPEVVLPQAPDFAIWSGNTTFVGETRGEVATKATTKYENDEVEINLALNDVHYLPDGTTQKYDVEDLVSHLSIHVRSAQDVTVTLPVPAKYYCDQDDVYIYNERGVVGNLETNFNEETNAVEYTFAGVPVVGDEGTEDVTVSVAVKFNPAVEKESEGSIVVSVTGVTENLLAALRETYGDGVNFDVYNYYNRANQYTTGSYAAYTVPQLLAVLNDSEVEFEESAPDYYINAFTGDEINYEGEAYYRDCWVSPVNASAFWTPALGENGWNHVYLNKTAFPNAIDGGVVKGDTPWVVE